MTYAAAKANLLHTGIFLAAKYLRFRLVAPIGDPIPSAVSYSTRPTPAIRGHLPASGGVVSDGRPYSVVPDAPISVSRVPHHLSPGRPRRLGWLRWRPCRRGSPGPPTRRGGRPARMLPVVAAIPVPVQDIAPRGAPWIARAPVLGGGRRRLRDGAAGQAQNGQRQHQHGRRPPQPRSRSLDSRHLPRISRDRAPGKWLFGLPGTSRWPDDDPFLRRLPRG